MNMPFQRPFPLHHGHKHSGHHLGLGSGRPCDSFKPNKCLSNDCLGHFISPMHRFDGPHFGNPHVSGPHVGVDSPHFDNPHVSGPHIGNPHGFHGPHGFHDHHNHHKHDEHEYKHHGHKHHGHKHHGHMHHGCHNHHNHHDVHDDHEFLPHFKNSFSKPRSLSL